MTDVVEVLLPGTVEVVEVLTGTVGPTGAQGDPATNFIISVAGRQGVIVLTKADVGLASVDDTADTAKPVSTAQQAALNLKANAANPTFTGTVTGVSKTAVGLGNADNTSDAAKPVSTAQQAALDLKAPLAGPTFTGTVTGVSKAMVGLGNADNTADTAKPVSTAQQAAIDAASTLDRARANHTGTQLAATVSDFSTAADARITAQKGAASGLAPLDAGSKISSAYLPAIAITSVYTVASQAAQLALSAQEGDVAIRSDLNQTYIQNGGSAGTMADWTVLATPTDVVTSVAGRTGVVVLVKADVGLGNADNTSDVNKPVSTAQAAADALKANAASPALTGTITIDGDVDLYRSAADTLKTDDAFVITTALPSSYPLVVTNTDILGGGVAVWLAVIGKTALRFGQIGETVPRFYMAGTGIMNWGDGTLAVDTNLYRSAADTLKTDDSLVVGGTLSVTGTSAFTGAVTGVSKAMVGLGSADNTADTAKPVSTAQQAALDLKAPLASPTFTGTVTGVSKAMVGLGNADNTADTAKPVSTAQQTALDLKAPLASPTFTGTVAGVSKAMVGLPNADNTSDVNKPVSTAQQAALDLKAPLASPTFTGTVAGVTKTMVGLGNADNTSDVGKPVSTAQQTALDLKAPLAAPALTGVVTIGGDVNLYRASADILKTDDAFVVSAAVPGAYPLTVTNTDTTGGGFALWLALATRSAMRIAQSGDAAARLYITGNGVLNWGDGTAAVDTNLYRSAADTLKTDDSLIIGGTLAVTGASAFTGAVTGLTKTTVGLSNVDNTADTAKPVSTAQQTALDLKAPLASPALTGTVTIGADVNLYRSAADILKTDDALIVVGNLTAAKLFFAAGQIYVSGSTTYFRNLADTAYLGIDVNNATIRGTITAVGPINMGPYALGTTNAINASVTGDTQNRIMMDASGKMLWGSGALAGDTNLYRNSADVLKTDDAMEAFSFRAVKASTGLASIITYVTGDAQNRFYVAADGALNWGSGAATVDTNLYRSAADTLKTDDALIVTGVLRAGTFTTGGRPAAATAGVGGQIYDTTLSKPIWSDGTTWRDAAGTAV